MRKILVMLLAVVIMSTGFGRAAEAREVFAKTGVSLVQGAVSTNWKGSETGSVAWKWSFLGELTDQISPRLLWSTTLKADFGQTHQYIRADTGWARPIKSTDRLRLDSDVRFTLGGWADPYLATVFESQFYDEQVGLGTKPLNPIVLSESGGIARAIFEERRKKLVTRLGFAFRQHRNTFLSERKTMNDGGVEWVTDWRFATADDGAVYLSKLTVYRAVFNSRAEKMTGEHADYWKTPDVEWENIVTNQLTTYLSLDLYFQFVYDKERSKTGQYKQTLGLGLVYQFL